MSSGRANVGVQHRGGRAGGFFGTRRGGGGGGGGGRRPWEGGDGPMGHRWEDTRRDGRVQKNGPRGRGRGGMGGRGRRAGAASNKNTWVSGQSYQKRYEGPREAPEGVNYDSTRVGSRASGLPRFLEGFLAVESHQMDRLMDSQATQYEAADVEHGVFVGANLDPRNIHSLIARAERTQPEGTRYEVQIEAVSEDSPSTSEDIKERFLGALVESNDRVAVDQDHDDTEVNPPTTSADEAMDQERRRDAAGDTNYEKGDQEMVRRLAYYRDA